MPSWIDKLGSLTDSIQLGAELGTIYDQWRGGQGVRYYISAGSAPYINLDVDTRDRNITHKHIMLKSGKEFLLIYIVHGKNPNMARRRFIWKSSRLQHASSIYLMTSSESVPILVLM